MSGGLISSKKSPNRAQPYFWGIHLFFRCGALVVIGAKQVHGLAKLIKIYDRTIIDQTERRGAKAPLLSVGGAARALSEPHHRGMKFGFALHAVDDWVQALPAGGPSRTLNLNLRPSIDPFCAVLAQIPAFLQAKMRSFIAE